ncbi:uncharacterized protein DDB_G0284459-like [Portunus trituberculatus]|uniref:uncharacterized protein DDB_G0284459-like n=1 Tax=Portunus trituberculatus TaxID=210409 RepID=UPI001E1D0C80|nr:uncharacterized protein DDB_G0284459-like [Portunus trituberculatus]
MRYSGLMPPERPVASLSSNHPKRLRKQIVFKIGETIHSGPSLVAPAVLKDEDLITTSKCVFPSNLQESSQIPLDSDHLAQIPSTKPSSPQPSETPCFIGHTSLQSCTPCTQYYLGTKGSLPAAYVPDVLVPKIIVSKVSKTVRSAATKSDSKSCTAKALNGKRVKKIIVPKNSIDETCSQPVIVSKSAVPQCKSVEDLKSRTYLRSGRAVERFENIQPVIKKEPDEALDPVVYLNTIKDESFTSIESGMIELPERKPEVYEAIHPEFNKGRLLIKVVQRATPTEAVVDSLDLSTNLSRAGVAEENKEMVRLIQEADSKLDSFCPKRSSRASKRIGSAEFGVIEIKPEPVTRVRRCTRTRKCSCRSDKSESETSDSRSVADEALYFDMVDKTAKLGKPKNGEPLLDEATTHVSAKYNGDVSSEIANGAHKVKGRRVSRANSDESDSNSGSKSNGNIDHNGDKVDFSVLLEISPADRKKFESKKAKIRRKTADWLLISETEQYYNEKEEIMRNKNKLDSESESDESDTCTENQDSRSDCSDESESTAGSSRRNKGKGKPARPVEDDSRPSAKRPKEDLCSQKKRGRPVVSRTRKTLYDLTMLNDDDDDDENFFGFPVSTTIPQSTRTSCTVSGSASQTRSKVKESCKHSFDLSSGSGKVGRKRLSDAERFLRDNREYYHFQETTERLRRSTSSSAEKEKSGRLDGCEVKEVEKKEESRLREPPPPPVSKKRSVVDGRRVTRSAGIILEEPDSQGKPKVKSVEKNDSKCTGKNVEKTDVKEKDKRKLPDDPKKKAPEEDKRRGCEGNKRKCVVESRRISNDVDKKESEDKKDSDVDKKESAGKKGGDVEKKVFEDKKDSDIDKKVSDDKKDSDVDRKVSEEKKDSDVDKKLSEDKKDSDVDKKVSEERKDSDLRTTALESENRTSESIADYHESEGRTKYVEVSSCNAAVVSNSECTESRGKRILRAEIRETSRSDLQDLYFSFEGVPDQESWYQTYQRLVDGVCSNEFCYEEEPLKFVLPYEMPKEYVRDFLCYKKGMLAKKKNDLADLVRKSPRCHASTLALFSDIIPTKRVKNAKVLRSAPVRVEEASSDGTSTPGAESTKLPPPECFESTEELAILALHIDHIMKSEGCYEEVPVCNPHIEDLKESEGLDYKKTPPKKRGKKKRLMAGSKSEKAFENAAKELKLFDNSLAQEVDPVFIAGLCDDMKDFLIPENILAREASEVVEDSCFCVCTDRASCDEFSSADDNTEASSECVSLCDSETIDCSVISEPKRGRSAKKRRKNLTGWPKTQKRKKPAPSHTSDDNDSALGWDDLEPKKHRCWKKQQDFSLLEQTTSERLAALAACDRRASPRKKASVLYMDTWPVRFRTQK